MLRAIYKFLASLKLAIILLAVLVYACAMGTYYESKYNADVAGALIYKSWWFSVWILLLATNVFCVAAIRYPWKPHQTGFVITHAGILVLLLGGMIDREWGVEGYLQLRRGSPALTEMRLHDQELLVYSPHRSDPARTRMQAKADMHFLMQAFALEAGDVKDWGKLCAGLVEAGRYSTPAPGKPFWKALPEAGQEALQQAAGGGGGPPEAAVVDALNAALRNRSLYQPQHFAQVNLAGEAAELLALDRNSLSDKEVLRLNRLLLAAAFPDLVAPGAFVRSPKPAQAHESSVHIRVLDSQGVSSSVVDLAPAESGSPMALVVLQSDLMGLHTYALQLDEEASLGPATLRFAAGKAPEAGPAEPAPRAPEDQEALVPSVERHYLFTRAEGGDMSTVVSGQPTDAVSQLVLDKAGAKHVLKVKLKERDCEIPVLDNLRKPWVVEGLPEWSVLIKGFFPDFQLVAGKPGSISEDLNNPCVLFELRGPLVKPGPPEDAGHGTMGLHGHGGAGTADGMGAANVLTLFVGEDGALSYQLKSRKTGASSGALQAGQALVVPWGGPAGAKFTVKKVLAAAVPVQVWQPAGNAQHEEMDSFYSGFLCEVESGGETQRVWAGPRLSRGARGTPVHVNGTTLELAYEERYQGLPFPVELMDTSAPQQEGMEGSNSFMAFESILSFEGQRDEVRLLASSPLRHDPEVESGDGLLRGTIQEVTDQRIQFLTPEGKALSIPREDVQNYTQRTRKIHMNNPTIWPPTWYGPYLGTCYKFSQADQGMLHNPPDPLYSGVQVLRDPGWMPKWVGSLMICFGIFTMFYLKPYFRRAHEAKQAVPKDLPAEQPAVKVGAEQVVAARQS